MKQLYHQLSTCDVNCLTYAITAVHFKLKKPRCSYRSDPKIFMDCIDQLIFEFVADQFNTLGKGLRGILNSGLHIRDKLFSPAPSSHLSSKHLHATTGAFTKSP